MVSELEDKILAAAEPIRATRFAEILHNARVSNRDPSLPGPDDNTQGWELSFDPAIQRTLGAATAVAMTRRMPPDVESDWYKWNVEAKRAINRFAAKCWTGIDKDRRSLLLDEDNFQPIWGIPNVFDLRSDSPGRHLDFEGLNTPDVRTALQDVYESARLTPAYAAALEADRELTRSRDKLILWAHLAKRGHDDLDAALRNLAIADGRTRGREIVQSLYAGTDLEDIAAAFRQYNRLVQQIVWSILGLAEMVVAPLVLREAVGTLHQTHFDDGSPLVSVTSTEPTIGLARLTHPVWLATGSPLDGLHSIVGYTMSLGQAAVDDLSLTPIRWSAGLWFGSATRR